MKEKERKWGGEVKEKRNGMRCDRESKKKGMGGGGVHWKEKREGEKSIGVKGRAGVGGMGKGGKKSYQSRIM